MIVMPASVFAYTQARISVHDPSVVWEPTTQTYYVFGSHQAWAKSTDLMNWSNVPVAWRTASTPSVSCETAFNVNATTTIKVGGANCDFRNGNGSAFDVEAYSAAGDGSYDISGNLWAPDVIWNPTMGKWCMYLSINGNSANCSIILLTSDKIEGPYLYQGPVVFSGFNIGSSLSYKYTDLEIALGTQASLPSRYDVGTLSGWCHRWPNAIDPCVFYDEEGKLWMSYGSWHGGIFMLELDEETGLRDYDVDYAYTQGSSADDVREDPYFGKKIAGGRHVSGEASYIKYIDGYYYLFVTYGGLTVNAGYQMRVFRSTSPDGPYEDSFNSAGVAIYDQARVNYGPDGTRKTNRGENIFGAYGDWGFMATGDNSERSQGHNSVITQGDQTFMVYHTRFQNRAITEAHELRVHQVFVNKDGWLCAAPFEYTGETVTNSDIKATQQVATANIPGNYKVLLHDKNLDHANKQLKTPVDITLNANGTITGDKTGTWSITSGTSYITIKIDESGTYKSTYEGVLVEQTLEPTNQKVIAFTAVNKKKEDRNSGDGGNTLWGYKAPATTTIGATTKGWGDAGCCTSAYTLASNKTVTFTFSVDATRGDYSYDGYAGIIAKSTLNDWGTNQYAFIRSMCDYKVGAEENWNTGATYNVNNYPGANDGEIEAKKLAHLPGSIVTMKMERHGSEVLVTTDIANAGITYRHYYVQNLGTTDDAYVFLGADHAQLTVISVETTTTEAYPAIVGTLHGVVNNTGAFAVGPRTDITLPAGKTLKLHFKNYSNGLQAWFNWVLEVQKGSKYLDLRADNYGWSTHDYYNQANITLENYPSWEIFRSYMNGADVEMTISRETANTLSVVAKQTLTNGTVATERYTLTHNDFATGDATVRLLTEGAHLDLQSYALGLTATISEYGWATFCGNAPLDMANVDGLTAYAVTGHNGNNINKVEINAAVAASTPMLLEGTANTTYFIPTAVSGTAPAGNLLKAGTGANVSPESGKTKYALSVEGGEACFKKITAARAIPVGKAYLQFNETIEAREFLGLDGDATGIDEANSQQLTANSQYFDLQGRKVAQPTKGLYIVNGKKVILH